MLATTRTVRRALHTHVVRSVLSSGAGSPDKLAVSSPDGSATYGEVLRDSAAVSASLNSGPHCPAGGQVAILARPGPAFVAALLGVWRSGRVAVPLSASQPVDERAYVTEQSQSAAVVADAAFADDADAVAAAVPGTARHQVEELIQSGSSATDVLDDSGLRGDDDAATILYTSGTTGRPKGVLTTHHALATQVSVLVDKWGWSRDDAILHLLPLHHVHGLVNKLLCPLAVGATVHFHPFSAADPWAGLLAHPDLTLLMAVPTVYTRMLHTFHGASAEDQARWRAAAQQLRLMVSGSAALPERVKKEWETATGHVLLERYGMTEFGMSISQGLDLSTRATGLVGQPLPGVEVKLRREDGSVVPQGSEDSGELLVRGPNVFQEYWRNPEATAEAFDDDGFFFTGDIAAWSASADAYRILGRSSVDIIKTSGHKVSALEVERAMLEHPDVAEVAVVGVPDDVRGEAIHAVVTLHAGGDQSAVLAHCRDRNVFGADKKPRAVLFMDELPKNAMGKIVKKQLLPVIENAGDSLATV